ncbi:MAG: hypothetical protein ACM3KR_05885 [Deltaproteobacteria bacterium]
MKILIVDHKKHEELRNELQKYEIILEQKEYIPDETKEDGYQLIVLCPDSIEDLRRMFDTLILRRMNPVVLYEHADDRFINFCTKLGCVDVVITPYKPELLAKRLWSVIESISSRENSESVRENLEIRISVEDFIKREMKNSSRLQVPLGFLAGGFVNGCFTLDRADNVVQKLKKCLRDTDFITAYGSIILVMLSGCGENELKLVEHKLIISAGDADICFYGFVKESFYDKNPINELQGILNHLINDCEKKLIEVRAKQKAKGL